MTHNTRTYSHEEEYKSVDASQLLIFLWSKRSFLITVEIVFFVLGISVAFLIPQRYTAFATLMPPQPMSGSTQLLSQFTNIIGDIPFSGSESIVDLYPDIAKSRSVLEHVLSERYNESTYEQTLMKVFKFDADEKEFLIERLKKQVISGSVNNKTNSVTINATTGDPELSAALVNEILNQMESFFRYQLKTVASSQRIMIEERLNVIADSLSVAEENLMDFNENNRRINSSPSLQIALLRLEREVEIKNTVYIELNRQLEVIKISELQYRPILNVLEKAVPPLRRSSPNRRKIVMIFLLLGFVLSFGSLKLIEVAPRILKSNVL